MSGLSNRTHTGEAATEKLREYFASNECFAASRNVGHFIRWLDKEGFIIVPKPYKAPARRGNSKPSAYTGPDMIGKSHSERLING